MRAIVCPKYGPPDVLQLTEVETPEPRANEVRIRVHTTTVHIGDVRIRAFNVPAATWIIARLMLGLTGPRHAILGMELAGTVDACGDDVARFKVGDPVFAFTGFSFGAYAEYICLPVDGPPRKHGMVALKPPNLTFEEAAPLAGGAITALLVLRKANLQPGQSVLIYGASGSVGTFAVQLASHHFGAEVTAVCSAANFELVRSLGASQVIDYTEQDFTETGESWDVVFDAVDKFPRPRAKRALAPSGTYLNVDVSSNNLEIKTADLIFLGELAAAGTLRSVIDRRYAFEEIVDAHAYVEQGHKRGNVTVQVLGGS